MSIDVPIVSASGVKSTKSVPDPTVVAPSGVVKDFNSIDDIEAVFKPQWTSPATQGAANPSAFGVDAAGVWDFACADNMVTPWDSGCKAILTKTVLLSTLGKVDKFSFDLFLPTQALLQTWHCGVLFELHTDTSSGHCLALNQNGTFRVTRQTGLGGAAYTVINGPAVAWNTWIPVVFDLKWSRGADGYLKVFIGATQVVNYTGATAFANDDNPGLQFGWYSTRPSSIVNKVKFRNFRRVTS